jgi:excisionase family DNA binding protein
LMPQWPCRLRGAMVVLIIAGLTICAIKCGNRSPPRDRSRLSAALEGIRLVENSLDSPALFWFTPPEPKGGFSFMDQRDRLHWSTKAAFYKFSYTAQEVARLLDLSVRTVERMERDGRLTPSETGRRKFSAREVERYLEQRGDLPTSSSSSGATRDPSRCARTRRKAGFERRSVAKR